MARSGGNPFPDITDTAAAGLLLGNDAADLVGFWGKAPVARPAGIADPAAPGVVYVQAEAAAVRNALVAVISALEALGIIATV